jgi:hypothetical protein
MKKILIGIFIILTFVSSFLLASYFNDYGVNLHAQLNKSKDWLESLLSDNEQSPKPQTNKKPIKTVQPLRKIEIIEYYQHSEIEYSGHCKDTSLGEIKYKKIGEIYTWTDEKEIVHFSSTPPQKGDFELLSYAKEKVFDYFTLDLNTENLPYDFNEKLTLKLNKLFEIYGQLITHTSLKKVDINLRVYASLNSFNQVKINHNMPISDNTPGFYSHASNQAHLVFTNYAATMRTATHEATHAINRGIIGYSPKWLNEGLAEYSEYITVTAAGAKIYPNETWVKKQQLSELVLPLQVLLSANYKDWNSELVTRFYATSWAFIYFMMDHKQRKEMLATIIKNEQENLCDVADIAQIEKVIGMPIRILQEQFNQWIKLKLKAHTI